MACARDLLSKFYDIQGPVKEDLVEDLLKHIKEEEDREAATKMLLGNQGGKDAKVEISEVFQKFPSLEVDFATFVSYLDPLSGRL